MAVKREQARTFLRRTGATKAEIDTALGDAPTRGPLPYAQKGQSGQDRQRSYGAKRTFSRLIGRNFSSNFERRIADRLWRRQEAGEISDLTFQPRVTLLGCVRMVPDFRYVEDDRVIHHEAKGFANDRWRMQRKLWAQLGPTEYRVTHQKGTDEVITPRPSDELIELVQRYLKEKHDTQ